MQDPSADPRPKWARSRREMLSLAGGGFGGLALASLLAGEGLLGREAGAAEGPAAGPPDPLRPRPSHYAPRAKHVISLFMFGGMSAMDTFDPKPELDRRDGESVAGKKEFDTGGRSAPGKLMKSPWAFKRYGGSGMPISDLFPHLGGVADELAVIRSMKSESNNHVPAVYFMLSGSAFGGRPGLGSWLAYGLGSQNQSLPAFVVMTDPRALVGGGAGNWSAGFLPSNYQGVQFRSQGSPVLNLKPPADLSPERQRAQLDLIGRLNGEFQKQHPGEQDLAARIRAYELAFRMQTEAMEAVDLEKEPDSVKKLYGMDRPETEIFGRQCLLARRMVERGVRCVQLYSGGGVFDQSWDAHNAIKPNHEKRAGEVDYPVAGLIRDLRQRGLLSETLVVCHTEFGRMPFTEGNVGRDHNPRGFTVWLAGAGVKGGTTFGATDDLGYRAAENVRTVFDLHATTLHLMGIDHTRLTYPYGGRDMLLTDVSGEVIKEVLE